MLASEWEGGVMPSIPPTGTLFSWVYLMCKAGASLFKPVIVPFASISCMPQIWLTLQAISAWLDPNTFSCFVPGRSCCINYSGNDCGERRRECFIQSNEDAGSDVGPRQHYNFNFLCLHTLKIFFFLGHSSGLKRGCEDEDCTLYRNSPTLCHPHTHACTRARAHRYNYPSCHLPSLTMSLNSTLVFLMSPTLRVKEKDSGGERWRAGRWMKGIPGDEV